MLRASEKSQLHQPRAHPFFSTFRRTGCLEARAKENQSYLEAETTSYEKFQACPVSFNAFVRFEVRAREAITGRANVSQGAHRVCRSHSC